MPPASARTTRDWRDISIHSLLPGCPLGREHSCVRWQRRGSAKNPYPSYRLRLQGNSLPSVGSRSTRLLRLAASRSKLHGWEELIPTNMLRVLRGKILRPETVHASEPIIAVERPLLLDKMPMVANVQAAPAQPGRTQTPFGNGRALRRWQSGRGRSVRISRIPVPVSAADRKNRDSCRPLVRSSRLPWRPFPDPTCIA